MASKKTPTHDNAKKAHSSAKKSAGSNGKPKKKKPDPDTLSEYEHGQAWERGEEFETDPDESAADGDT